MEERPWRLATLPKQDIAELAKRRRFSDQAVDFRPYRGGQRQFRCVSAQCAEFMLEVLLGLRRDIPTSPFPLEFGDELPGCAHLATIAQSAAVEDGIGPVTARRPFSPVGRGVRPCEPPASAPAGRSSGFCRPPSEAGWSASQNRPAWPRPALRQVMAASDKAGSIRLGATGWAEPARCGQDLDQQDRSVRRGHCQSADIDQRGGSDYRLWDARRAPGLRQPHVSPNTKS